MSRITPNYSRTFLSVAFVILVAVIVAGIESYLQSASTIRAPATSKNVPTALGGNSP